VKALLRRGTARQMLHKYEEAIKDYKLVIVGGCWALAGACWG
jgi:hypothetical protein